MTSKLRVSSFHLSRPLRGASVALLALGALLLNPALACSGSEDPAEPDWEYGAADMLAVSAGTYAGTIHFSEGDAPFTLELGQAPPRGINPATAGAAHLRPQCGSYSRELSLVKPAGACMVTWVSNLELTGNLSSEGTPAWSDLAVEAMFTVEGERLEYGWLAVHVSETETLQLELQEGRFGGGSFTGPGGPVGVTVVSSPTSP